MHWIVIYLPFQPFGQLASGFSAHYKPPILVVTVVVFIEMMINIIFLCKSWSYYFCRDRYIEESLMALDTHDDVTREHMPVVVEGLCQQLQLAIQEASGPMQRSLKMLLMAARSLLR